MNFLSPEGSKNEPLFLKNLSKHCSIMHYEITILAVGFVSLPVVRVWILLIACTLVVNRCAVIISYDKQHTTDFCRRYVFARDKTQTAGFIAIDPWLIIGEQEFLHIPGNDMRWFDREQQNMRKISISKEDSTTHSFFVTSVK